METLLQGGLMMWCILLVSITAGAIVFERFLYLHKTKRQQKQVVSLFEASVVSKKKDKYSLLLKTLEAKKLNPFDALLKEILQNQKKDFHTLEKITEALFNEKIEKLEKGLSALATSASIAPLMGLLGTVFGMIQSFTQIAGGHSGGEEIAGGISKALLTTAFGLMVAIPCIIFYNYFSKKVDSYIKETNIIVLKIIHSVRK